MRASTAKQLAEGRACEQVTPRPGQRFDGALGVIPSPATHAILLQLKAGETAGSYIRSVKDTFRHYIGCVRQCKTLFDTI